MKLKKEIEGLSKRFFWKVVRSEEVLDRAKILDGNFVLAINDEGTNKAVRKARLVVQGQKDSMKQSSVYIASASQQ